MLEIVKSPWQYPIGILRIIFSMRNFIYGSSFFAYNEFILSASIFSIDELSEICDQNEINAAKDSLNSELIHWQDGKKVICREWIQNLLSDLSSTAENFGMKHLLNPIYKVLEEGNQSMKWINQYKNGLSIEQIMKVSIEDMINNEKDYV